MKIVVKLAAAFSFWSLAALLLVVNGCNSGATAGDEDSGDFAPGAFPPTLSDVDYHQNSWTEDKCLVCHESGANDAPVTEHKSLPALAKDVKCRSCHVFIKGSKPIPLETAKK